MAADVVFTEEGPWYTNSHTWSKITEYAAKRPGGPSRDDYPGHLDALGVDFTFLPDETAAGVAGWLAGVVEGMVAEGEMGHGEADRAHAGELIRKLRSEARVRNHSA